MEKSVVKPPTSFWVISIVALLWNLMGMLQFFAQAFVTDDVLAALPENQRELYADIPQWVLIVFAIAVFAGTLGCIVLLIRKKWAKILFTISLIAVLIQSVYNLFMSNAPEVLGSQVYAMPVFIIIISLFLIWYSGKAYAKGWIS
tara:strand:+ start:334 stop:768 length:435 start_codon:yes stop_codon:yes gene_type:complete